MHNKTQLYIDGYLVDVAEGAPIAQTFQINTFFDPQDRQTNFTNRISLPFTDRNREVFERLGLVGDASRYAYRSHNARLVRDGVTLINGGLAIISRATQGTYDLVIYDGNISLFETIAESMISDLDLSAYNHQLTNTTFADSLDNTSGYIYALVDNGRHATGSPLIIDHTIPCLFVHTLWDDIFSAAGYTYIGDVFSSDEFLNLLAMPNNAYTNVAAGGGAILQFDGTTTNTVVVNGLDIDIPFIGADPGGVLGPGGAWLRIQQDGNYNLELDIEVNVTPEFVGYYNVSLLQNGTPISSINVDAENFTGVLDVNYFFNVGDQLTLQLRKAVASEIVPDPFTTLDYDIDVTLNLDDTFTNINFNQLFRDGLSQRDFLKDIMQRFGLVLQATSVANQYEFVRTDVLLGDRLAALDFSENFVLRRHTEYRAPDTGQSNKFTYQYQDSVTPFADGEIQVVNNTLPPEVTSVESPYQASQLTQKTVSGNSQLLYSTSHFVTDGADVQQRSPGSYIFLLLKINGSFNYKTESAGSSLSFSGDVPFATFEGMDWNSIIERHYIQFREVLSATKIVTALMKFSVVDIEKLDLLKIVYIRQLAAYFYINRVRNFVPKTLTETELILIPAFAVNFPPIAGAGFGTVIHGFARVFMEGDFTVLTSPPYFDRDGDPPQTLKIERVPHGPVGPGGSDIDSGNILLNGIVQPVGSEIAFSDIALGNLTMRTDDSILDAYQLFWEFSIADTGSGEFSNIAVFTFQVTANLAPVPDAGPDQVVNDATATTLDGSNSFDPEGNPITFAWSQIAGPNSANIVSPANDITAVNGMITGVYIFQLTVQDFFIHPPVPDNVQVTVSETTEASVAISGPTSGPGYTDYTLTFTGGSSQVLDISLTTGNDNDATFDGGSNPQNFSLPASGTDTAILRVFEQDPVFGQPAFGTLTITGVNFGTVAPPPNDSVTGNFV